MSFGDYQIEIYFQGLAGVLPSLPMSFVDLESRAQQAMSPSIWSYVAGGAGDELTQRGNAEAFNRWGLIPRMLVGATERDLSVELWGRRWAAPVFMAPIGVIGLCTPDRHGDLALDVGAPRIRWKRFESLNDDIKEVA
jgi:lactate 2-monooxygenase